MSLLNLAIFFLIVSFVAAIFGFSGIAQTGMNIARLLFFVFVVLFAITILVHFLG